jgi:hypothetical protein
MFKNLSLIKTLFSIAKTCNKYAGIGGLVIDTFKYFHDEGKSRGIFVEPTETETK